ncbi:MAG: rRNA maturation RNase YbeY, partial [Candidatus Paceibacteria bacterium]
GLMEVTIVGRSQIIPLEWIYSICNTFEDVVGPQAGEVSVVFVDKDEMKRLNQTYRSKSESTNVLAFPLTDGIETYQTIGGDICISESTACTPKKQTMATCKEEICYLVIHALLHLLDYDHHTEADFQAMSSKETEIWNRLSLV